MKAFSADILKYNCQAVQYIGELARYLVNAPPNADDDKLNIKYAFGNGLNKEIWAKFQVGVFWCFYVLRFFSFVIWIAIGLKMLELVRRIVLAFQS